MNITPDTIAKAEFYGFKFVHDEVFFVFKAFTDEPMHLAEDILNSTSPDLPIYKITMDWTKRRDAGLDALEAQQKFEREDNENPESNLLHDTMGHPKQIEDYWNASDFEFVQLMFEHFFVEPPETDREKAWRFCVNDAIREINDQIKFCLNRIHVDGLPHYRRMVDFFEAKKMRIAENQMNETDLAEMEAKVEIILATFAKKGDEDDAI